MQWDLILVVVRGLRRENELGVLEKESLSSHEEEGEEEGQRRRRVEWKMARWGGGEGWRWNTNKGVKSCISSKVSKRKRTKS